MAFPVTKAILRGRGSSSGLTDAGDGEPSDEDGEYADDEADDEAEKLSTWLQAIMSSTTVSWSPHQYKMSARDDRSSIAAGTCRVDIIVPEDVVGACGADAVPWLVLGLRLLLHCFVPISFICVVLAETDSTVVPFRIEVNYK